MTGTKGDSFTFWLIGEEELGLERPTRMLNLLHLLLLKLTLEPSSCTLWAEARGEICRLN